MASRSVAVKEKLQEYAQIAEIIGGAAIVISLVFVGFQIKSNTEASKAATLQQISAGEIQLLAMMADDPVKARVVTRAMFEPQSLTEEERMQGYYLFMANIRNLENLYLQYESGFLSEEAWNTKSSLLNLAVNSPGFGMLLENQELNALSGPFVEYAKSIRRSNGLPVQ
jgi:hypothetical protein